MEEKPAGAAERAALLETESATCPLCDGRGRLSRAELARLGVRDVTQVAELAAQAAVKNSEVVELRHQQEVDKRLQAERDKLSAQNVAQTQQLQQQLGTLTERLKLADEHKQIAVEKTQQENVALRRELDELRMKLAGVSAIKGKVEELDFEAEVRGWAEVELGQKELRLGDYQLWLRVRDAAGNLNRAPNAFIVDNKDDRVNGDYVKEIVAAAKHRKMAVGILVFKRNEQLTGKHADVRWSKEQDVWVLKTTRAWLRRDLEVLRPMIERLACGDAALDEDVAAEVAATLRDLDTVSKHVEKATGALVDIQKLCTDHVERLRKIVEKARS